MSKHSLVPVEMRTKSNDEKSPSLIADNEVIFRLNEAGQIVTRKYQLSTEQKAFVFDASLGLWIVKESSGQTVYISAHAVILVHTGKALK